MTVPSVPVRDFVLSTHVEVFRKTEPDLRAANVLSTHVEVFRKKK